MGYKIQVEGGSNTRVSKQAGNLTNRPINVLPKQLFPSIVWFANF